MICLIQANFYPVLIALAKAVIRLQFFNLRLKPWVNDNA